MIKVIYVMLYITTFITSCLSLGGPTSIPIYRVPSNSNCLGISQLPKEAPLPVFPTSSSLFIFREWACCFYVLQYQLSPLFKGFVRSFQKFTREWHIVENIIDHNQIVFPSMSDWTAQASITSREMLDRPTGNGSTVALWFFVHILTSARGKQTLGHWVFPRVHHYETFCLHSRAL